MINGLVSLNSINLFFALIFFTSILLFGNCKPTKKEEIEAVTIKDTLPVETAKKLEILYSDSGRVKVKIKAGKLNRFAGASPYLEFPDGIHVWFYNIKHEPESEMSARFAVRYEVDAIIEAKKNVVVINEQGDILNTEHLIWDEKTQMIRTEAFVKITTKDEIIIGEGMEADQYFRKYKIRNIKGTFNLKTK